MSCYFKILGLIVLIFSSTSALSQEDISQSLPLEITAEQDIKWDQQNRIYTAQKNARAAQGNFEVTADILRAFYTQNADTNKTEITHLTGEGNVVVSTAKETMKAPKMTVYLAKQPPQPPAQNDLFSKVSKANASGGVTILQEDLMMTGVRADYTSDRRIITLYENVEITQNDNILRGDQAEFNVDTRVSTLKAPKGGKVTGLIFPDQK